MLLYEPSDVSAMLIQELGMESPLLGTLHSNERDKYNYTLLQ